MCTDDAPQPRCRRPQRSAQGRTLTSSGGHPLQEQVGVHGPHLAVYVATLCPEVEPARTLLSYIVFNSTSTC